MRFNNPLTNILDNKTKLICLRVMCRCPTKISGRQLAKIVNINPTTVNKAMKGLAKENIISFRPVGKSYLYELNKTPWVVSKILVPMFKLEGQLLNIFINQVSKTIKGSPIKDSVLSVALFGSVHEQKEGPGSDIDLFIVIKDAKDKKKVENLFFDTNFFVGVEPYIKTVAEFKKDRELSVIKSIQKSHQIIWGESLERIV